MLLLGRLEALIEKNTSYYHHNNANLGNSHRPSACQALEWPETIQPGSLSTDYLHPQPCQR